MVIILAPNCLEHRDTSEHYYFLKSFSSPTSALTFCSIAGCNFNEWDELGFFACCNDGCIGMINGVEIFLDET